MIKNDTLRFVLPMFYNAATRSDANFFINQFFVGAFTSDFSHPEYDDKLILAYQYFPSEEFASFEKKLISLYTPIVYESDIPDIFLYVIEIPEEYLSDYSLITGTIVNKLSPDLKLKIIKMWGLTEDDPLFKVLIGKREYEGEPFENEIFNFNEEENVTEIL